MTASDRDTDPTRYDVAEVSGNRGHHPAQRDPAARRHRGQLRQILEGAGVIANRHGRSLGGTNSPPTRGTAPAQTSRAAQHLRLACRHYRRQGRIVGGASESPARSGPDAPTAPIPMRRHPPVGITSPGNAAGHHRKTPAPSRNPATTATHQAPNSWQRARHRPEAPTQTPPRHPPLPPGAHR